VPGIFLEAHPVLAGDEPQVRKRGQVINSIIAQHARIGDVKLRIRIIELQKFQFAVLGEDRQRCLPRLLFGPFRYAQQQPALALETECARV